MTESAARWVRLELMGHRERFGRLTETTVAGAPFLQIDLPFPEGGSVPPAPCHCEDQGPDF